MKHHWTGQHSPSQSRLARHNSWLWAMCVMLGTVAGASCTGGSPVGHSCDINSDCDTALQCANRVCTPLCNRSVECGDGQLCTESGYCIPSVGRAGDTCLSETACSAGLACKLDSTDIDRDGVMQATCTPNRQGHPVGSLCKVDGDCRNGNCAVGRCVDVCRIDRDCGVGQSCTSIPRVEAGGAQFFGCLQAEGTVTYEVTASGTAQSNMIAVPGNAESFSLVMQVDDTNQRVGLTNLVSPRGRRLYKLPTTPEEYYSNLVRHFPERSSSIAQVPSSLAVDFERGPYKIDVQSFRSGQPGQVGSATPRTTVAIKVGKGLSLDLHLVFLDLAEHPCLPRTTLLNATSAQTDQGVLQFINGIRSALGKAGIVVSTISFDDLAQSPEHDSLTIESARKLFLENLRGSGVTVFVVRSISPAGIAAIGPTPGPVGVLGTGKAGIALSLESLCYRDWSQFARIASHQVAGYLGLFPNIDIEDGGDPISDTDGSSGNLMYYSELGGTELSPEQIEILRRSPALR